jgi:hypothetical protein
LGVELQNGSTRHRGHVGINQVPGALANIDRLGPGDKLEVEDATHGAVRFDVAQTMSIAKGDLSAEYFTPKYNGWLLLITCGGDFDSSTGHYRRNVVTLAKPE